jgi:hypothetical protein
MIEGDCGFDHCENNNSVSATNALGDSMATGSATLKPIILYDHLAGILAGYPAALFAILALLSLPQEFVEKRPVQEAATATTAAETSETSPANATTSQLEYPSWVPNPHMLFWIGLSVMIVWYIAFRFNMPKNKFWLMFGLFGTFVGIPVVLEVTNYIRPFTMIARWLGYLAPQVNAGAFFVLAIVFFIIWLANFIWSRTHMKVRIDESGLTLNRLGGKGERFELIGLKTENEPLDYLELFLCGVGSLALKTRMNKPIFKMDRVIGLYRIPIFPFFRGKLSRIEEMLSYQGKVVSVETQEAADAAEQMEADAEAAAEEEAAAGGEEYDAAEGDVDSGGGEFR